MRFPHQTTSLYVADAFSSSVATRAQSSAPTTSWLLIALFFAATFLCSLKSQNNATFAQNAPSNAQPKSPTSVQSPEEATGTSLRDFDALRAMSSEFLSNPDGQDVPIDEDDIWLPDLALGQKTAAQKAQSVRVISYNNGKATTEVRSTQTPKSNVQSKKTAKTSETRQAAVSKTTNNGSKRQSIYASPNATKRPSFASYTASATAKNKVLQTQGVFPTQTTGGFNGYESQIANSSVVGGFADYASGNDLFNSNTSAAPVQNDASNVGFGSYQPPSSDYETANEIQTSDPAPIQTQGLDVQGELPTNVPQESSEVPLTSVAGSDFPRASNADVYSDFPNASPPAVDSPSASPASPAVSEPQVVQPASAQPVLESPTPLAANSWETEPYRETFTVKDNLPTPTNTQAPQTEKTKTQSTKPDNSVKEISLEKSKLSESEMKKLTIEDVRISGLEMTVQQFNNIVKTRIGAKFNQQRLEEDKRALLQTKQFIDVAVSTSWSPDKPDKVIVNFDLTPRRLMRYIKIVGNKQVSKHDILEELGVKPGESRMDPYEVENGRVRIIEFYKSKDYAEPHVEILRGNRPEDVGVVYLIDEGVKQHVLKTTFVGNTVVSGARLRSLIMVKPGFLYIFGGKFTRDRLDADVEKLLEYYRQLGYFDARIDREYEETSGFAGLGKDNAWVTVRYIIDEGPRYKIRNFLFSGNRVMETKQLESELKVKRGSYYYYSDVEEDRVKLRCKYQDMGYVRADITPNLVFTDEVGVVDIRYDIKEDHRYRVHDVIVDYVGTESRTMTPVVLNMLDLTPGELLNGVKIRQSENTLRSSGYFNDKPSEGQLPEIAVIPDESSAYSIEKHNGIGIIKEARRVDDKEDKDKQESENSTTRGQEPNHKRITRGQAQESRSNYAPYVPYEQARASQAPVAQSTEVANSYRSYGPSAGYGLSSQPAQTSNASPQLKPTKTYISPVRPFTSIVRGQTTIPSGFSTTTTHPSSNSFSTGYQPYNSGASTSQFADVGQYANSTTNYDDDSSSWQNSASGFSTGVYDSVEDSALDPITPEEDEIYNGDVLIKLQEGRTGMFTASIGVNSDYGLVGNVSFTERNFNLFRPPTNFFTCDGWKDAFRGGGQILNVQASPGANIQSYRVSWDVPYVFNTKNTFGITGLYGDRSLDEWFESRYGGEIRVGRQWTPRFSTTLSGGMYNVKISDPQVTFVPDLNEVLGTSREYTLGLTAAYDTRNHPYTPSEGYMLKGTIEEVLGDYQFPRVSLGGRYFKTLRKRVDGSGRWVLGLATNAGWNGSDAPIYERFYGGGTSSIRGFEYRGITPRYQRTGFGIGGNFEFYNSAELLVPVSGGDEFQLAFFVDSGTVAKDLKNWGRYRVAPGFGFRVSIPMLGPAPLAIDFAFPVSKDSDDSTEVFSFSMGASR